MDQTKRVRVVKSGVAEIAFVNAEILMKINAKLPLAVSKIIDADASQKDVFMARNGIVAFQLDAEGFIDESDVCNKGFAQILEPSLPFVRECPRKLAIGPHAETKRKALSMIFLPDMREIYVADLIFIVKIDEQAAVADRYVTHKLAKGVL